ncbi:MAG: PD-(D/E)XK nuclease family protein [Chloroflexi bacterium]|nr:PD-(D/E)XK nuclease family protein [Chloroflexota bacterium]
MTLPENFQFSQSNLQDFTDCRRRFQLRHLQRLAWPALQAEPALENERLTRLGADFHRLIQQHLLGVPAERLVALCHDHDLARWWANYLQSAPAAVEGARHPEIGLSAPLAGRRLLARYDLIVVAASGRALIYDWKTGARRPKRATLAGRLQTRAYPYLLLRAGAHLNGGRPLQPEQVEMVYWFAEHPDQPERFPYSPERYAQDAEYLTGLVEQIRGLGPDDFPLTGDLDRCRFCVYRSLCDRGAAAGPLAELAAGAAEAGDELAIGALDFEQIAEIAF